MDNTTSMQAQHKLSFLHHIRLVPLFQPFTHRPYQHDPRGGGEPHRGDGGDEAKHR